MREDLTGKKFGKWVVLNFDKIKNRLTYWLCKCDCGTEKSVNAASLKNKTSTGCSPCGKKKRIIDPPSIVGQWTVTDEIITKSGQLHRVCICSCGTKSEISYYRLTHMGSTMCKKCASIINAKKGISDPSYKGTKNISGTYFGRLRDKAKTREIEFNVTIQELQCLLENQNFKCAISGVTITSDPDKGVKECLSENTASLDRIDSSKGYISGNVQWVHKTINQMKMALKEDEFFDFCAKATAHKNSK